MCSLLINSIIYGREDSKIMTGSQPTWLSGSQLILEGDVSEGTNRWYLQVFGGMSIFTVWARSLILVDTRFSMHLKCFHTVFAEINCACNDNQETNSFWVCKKIFARGENIRQSVGFNLGLTTSTEMKRYNYPTFLILKRYDFIACQSLSHRTTGHRDGTRVTRSTIKLPEQMNIICIKMFSNGKQGGHGTIHCNALSVVSDKVYKA